MVLDLTGLFASPGEKLLISYQLDFSGIEYFGEFLFKDPIEITGYVENRASLVILSISLSYCVYSVCSRCTCDIIKPTNLDFENILVRKLESPDRSFEENDDFILIPDAHLNLDEVITTNIILNIPMKQLCKIDCKGICQKCGKNQNESVCKCNKNQIDPRLESLTQLLDDKE
jgi:uncharacterized protein